MGKPQGCIFFSKMGRLQMKIHGIIENNIPKTTDKEKFVKWLCKNDGMYFTANYKILGKHKDPKTMKQLGYIFVVLVPAIHKQLVADGHTLDLEINGICNQIPITENATYEILNTLCGHVGKDGALIRLSDEDMDIHNAYKYIDGVLNVAMNLKMDVDKLKAKRPK